MKFREQINSSFLIKLLNRIKNELPPYVIKSLYKALPVSFLLSVIEILSLSTLFPIINIIINPKKIQENKILNEIYTFFHFQNDATFILIILIAIIIIFVLKNIAVYYFSKFQINLFYVTAEKLVLEKYRRYMNMPYGEHTNSNSSALLRNVLQVPYEFTNALLMPFNAVINELIIIMLLAISILIYNPFLFLILISVLFPLVYVYNRVHKRRLQNMSKTRDQESLNLYKQVSQSFEGIREFTVFDKKEYFYKTLKKSAANYTKINSESYLISYFSPKVIETVSVFAVFMVFLIGYIQGQNIEAVASILVLYSIALYKLIPSINKILLSLNNIRIADYTFLYLKKENTPEIYTNESYESLAFHETIKLKNIDFKYADSSKLVLSDINLQIDKGSRIGIVGASGSGKSTLLNIFLRLFEESKGGIYIDDKKISPDNIKALYKLVGYVPQNITIIEGSLLENIAFGIDKDGVDFDLLNKVIEKSQLSSFLRELPEGFSTQMGERGAKISGGQKQRIGIARALYHKAQILIFDEATSALDYETEKMLTESINSFYDNDMTIIIVAHRLQTLKYCDLIYKLNDGRLDTHAYKYEEII
jgi:ABC-type bacteriocin/lantibiotic exporter with double-glycine peptidase domain